MTGRPGTLPESIPGPGSQPGTPKGGRGNPDSQLRAHARPPPSTIWKSTASQSDTSKIPRPGRAPSPSRAAVRPRGSGRGSGFLGATARGGGELRAPHPPLSSPASWGWRGRPLPGRELRAAERSGRDRDSAAKFSSGIPQCSGAGSALVQTRSPAGSEAQGPESDCGWHVPRQPAAAPARLTSPQAETGLRVPAIRVAHAVPASRPRDPRRPLLRSRRCSPPPPRAAAAAQITTRRV